MAERGPLLLCVDDAHWADPPSLAFLSYLVQRIEELPVTVVITGGASLRRSRTLGAALRVVGLTTGAAEGVELLRESERVLASSPVRLEHARTLVELGAALQRGGHVREARKILRRGLDAAHGCGATVLVDGALDELRSAVARPRRPALTGITALTPAELRVAELASPGLSNREVAQRLFVTRRTVEMHLTAA